MSHKLLRPKKMMKIFIITPVIAVSLCDFILHETQAQEIWKSVDSEKGKSSLVIWETISESKRSKKFEPIWKVIPKSENQNQFSSGGSWEVLEAEEEKFVTPSQTAIDSAVTPPSSLEEAEALFDSIPIQSSDYKPLLNLSNAVPTTSVLSQEEWRLTSSTISPFKFADGTGNQNYAIQLDYGLSDTFQISGFYSEADYPLTAQSKV